MVDITAPDQVQVQIRSDGKVLWVNVDGECAFRACQIGSIDLVDDRRNDNAITIGAHVLAARRARDDGPDFRSTDADNPEGWDYEPDEDGRCRCTVCKGLR